MKSIVYSVFLSLITVSQIFGQNKKFYVVMKNSSDTLLFDELKYNDFTNTVKTTSNGISNNYKTKELKAFSALYNWNGILVKSDFKYTQYEVEAKNPEKEIEGNQPYIVMMHSGFYKILYYERVETNRTVQRYYIFEGDKFLHDVTKKNFRELFKKYFSSCSDFIHNVETENFFGQFAFAYKQDYICK